MYRKKKIDKKYILLIIGLIVIVFLAFIINIIKTDRDLNAFEKIIKDASLSVSSILYKPVRFIQNKINENKEKNNIYEKYEDLKQKYESIDFNESRIDELEKEINDLKGLLQINDTLSEYDKINASVVNRNIGYWYDTITIDKGSSSGITKDMAVITNEGLIGKILSTSNFYSTVRLLTSDELGQKISIKIKTSEDKYVYGLLSGYNKENKCFIIEGISENVDIPEGSIVTTTGMSNIFPSGILIGTVKGNKKDNFDLTMLVEVDSSTNLEDINYVSVLKRKVNVE